MKRPWAPRPEPSAIQPSRPLIVAHRGDSAARAEHTLEAYQAAIATGADGLECDVRLTRDGHLVCVHDRRVDRTSNGRGVVSDLDLAGLQSLDFGSWHDEWPDSADRLLADDAYLGGVAPDRDALTGSVLRLEALLALLADGGRPLRLLVETKHPTRYSGLVEKELVRVLHRFGHGLSRPDPPAAQVSVMSFASTALRRVRLLAPTVPTVKLQRRWKVARQLGELPGDTRIVGPALHLLRDDPGFVARSHARGHQVYVWTVDRDDDLDFVLGLGVDAVISNRPADALRARERTSR